MKKIIAMSISFLFLFSMISSSLSVSANETTDIAVQKNYPALSSEYYVKSISLDFDVSSADWTATGSVADGTAFYGTSRGYTSPVYNDNRLLYLGNLDGIGFRIWTKSGTTIYSYLGKENANVNLSKEKRLVDGWNTILYSDLGLTNEEAKQYHWLKYKTGSAVTVYVDEINCFDVYKTASFEGATSTISSIKCDENDQLNLPEATISSGNFAGWITEEDPDTILPANSVVTINEDTTFLAVSSTRATQEAPEAPTLQSKTYNSVTLTPNSLYQYSMDGTTWQNSNVFSGLTTNTEYTFYQRLKATPVLYASSASSKLLVTTNAVYFYEAENVYSTTDYSGVISAGANSDTATGSLMYVMHDVNNPTVGHYAVFNLNNLPVGYYNISLFSRNVSSRSIYTVTAYDETNAEQNLGAINFKDLSTKISPNQYYANPSLTETAVQTSGSTLKLKFTLTTKGSGSGFYIDKFMLTKVGDYVTTPQYDVTLDGVATKYDEGSTFTFPALGANGVAYTDGTNYYKAGDTVTVDKALTFTTLTLDVTMSAGAQMRVDPSFNGIRFLTNVDTAKVTSLKVAGATVSMGTLIAPKDLLGSEELTLTTDESKKLNVAYESDEFYTDGDFTGIVGSIVSIKESNTAYSSEYGNVNRGFVGRGYVTVTIGGVTTTVYGSYANSNIDNNTRSIGYIADAIKTLNGTDYTNHKDVVDKYAAIYAAAKA